MLRQLLPFCILCSMLLFSCVGKKKYLDARNDIAALRLDSTRLEQALSDLRDRLGKMEATNRSTNAQLQNTTEQLNQSQEEIEEQRRRLVQLQSLIDQQRKNTEALRQKIADALVNFGSNELTVSMKNGKVYVSMQESLLFPSGSATVNPRGKEALATLARALNQSTDINVEVEGHTDSIPISKRYADNWDLSVERSTAIARILVKEYFVHPARITASGRSEYNPIASNSTPEGRQQNRRTEIILEPKLDELMQLIRESK
ncbi:MAG: flagellar motor protein MotB [Sphingobacteriales bacterium]|nr:MAG: flagellar motor protein MotB [Sphingobacteriales bacterium]